MKINKFKVGDFIQRVKPNKTGDHSYCGDCLEFLGYQNDVIFFRTLEGIFSGEVHTVDGYYWNDDNWGYYPKQYADKVGLKFKSLVGDELDPNLLKDEQEGGK